MEFTELIALLNAGVPFAIGIMLYLTVRLEGHVTDCMRNHESLIKRMLDIIALTEERQQEETD